MLRGIHERLRLARLAAGYPSALEFARRHGIAPGTYAHHEAGTRGLQAVIAARYAQLLNTSVGWLLAEEGPGPAGLREPAAQPPVSSRLVEVVGTVEDGRWRDRWQLGPDDRYAVPVLAHPRWPEARLQAVRVVGSGMDRVFPDGSHVVIADFDELGRGPESGEIVVCLSRDRAGLVEATLRELELKPGGGLLWPRSTAPEHQEPVPLEAVRAPDGRIAGRALGAGFEVQIVARALGGFLHL